MDILQIIKEGLTQICDEMDVLLAHGAEGNPATIKGNLNSIFNSIIDYENEGDTDEENSGE